MCGMTGWDTTRYDYTYREEVNQQYITWRHEVNTKLKEFALLINTINKCVLSGAADLENMWTVTMLFYHLKNGFLCFTAIPPEISSTPQNTLSPEKMFISYKFETARTFLKNMLPSLDFSMAISVAWSTNQQPTIRWIATYFVQTFFAPRGWILRGGLCLKRTSLLEIKSIYNCTEQPHWKVAWKAGRHIEGGEAILMKYGCNGAHFHIFSPWKHS